MFNDNFTVEEINLIAIYLGEHRTETINNITAALPLMDGDMRILAEKVIDKLSELNETQYGDKSFIPADETDGG